MRHIRQSLTVCRAVPDTRAPLMGSEPALAAALRCRASSDRRSEWSGAPRSGDRARALRDWYTHLACRADNTRRAQERTQRRKPARRHQNAFHCEQHRHQDAGL